MHTHFLTVIIKNIDSYGLTSEQVEFFKKKTIIKDAEGKIAKGQSRSGGNYSEEENKMLLNYIVRKKAYSKVGGKALWEKMEEKEEVGDRSWESMRKRFRTLIKKIEEGKETYNLTKEQIALFINRGVGVECEESTDEDNDDEEEGEAEEKDKNKKIEDKGSAEAMMDEREEMEVDEPNNGDEEEEEEGEEGEGEEEEDEVVHTSRILVDF